MNPDIATEISELEPSTLVVLYELVLKGHGASYYFHAGENGFGNSIFFKDHDYYYIPIKAEGFDFSEDKLSRPTLTIDNTDSFLSLKTRFFKDFIGYTVKRTKTFVKFLHGSNFPNGTNPYGTATELTFPVEKFVINKKVIENTNVVQFELISPMEKEAAFLPNRKVVYNTCQWRYRHSIGCGYAGAPISDGNGNSLAGIYNNSTINEYSETTTYSRGDAVIVIAPPNSQDVDKVFVCLENNTVGLDPTTNKKAWAMDVCPKNIAGCRARFGNLRINDTTTVTESRNGLPFGGFPGTWEY